MAKAESLEDIKNEIGQKVDEVNILFLDVSSTCTGYSIFKVNFEKKTYSLTDCGALWLNNKEWRDQERYSYLFHALSQYFWIVKQVDYIVAEQYSINPKKMVGAQVLPELMGVVKTAAEENGIVASAILPQTWRSQLAIKPEVSKDKNGKNKRDYKTPTKDLVLEHFEIPDKSLSNITGKERTTPSDLYDAIAIGLGWAKKFGLQKLVHSEYEFNSHLGIIDNYINK